MVKYPNVVSETYLRVAFAVEIWDMEERSMNTKIMKGATAIIGLLMLATAFAGVKAAPVMPFTRYGDGGVYVAPASTLITAWIDGVEYGQNTSSATGTYTIETLGDEQTTADVKEGGLNGDQIRYVLGGRLTTAAAGNFADTLQDGNANIYDTYTAGAIIRGALSNYGTQPRQLKINNVSSQSTLNSAAGTPNDYIVIWNPAGATADITTYSLAVGVAAAQPIIAGDIWTYKMYAWTTNPVPASGFIAINMAKWGGLSATGNAIKLIHTATGFIVDRVEYGTIATAPENTILTNAAAPASAQQIRRNTAGTDTNSCSVDFGAAVAQWLPQDLIAPTSVVTAITPYFYHINPLSIACTNSDTGGGTVTSVSLWYRYSSPTNGTWGAWTMFNNDTTPTFGPWNFNWPSGTGFYEFYTRAGDSVGNWEAAPANPGDDNAQYDNVAPTSNVNTITPYFYRTSPLSIACTAADNAAPASGLHSVELWYRWSSPTNGTWGAWTLFNNDTATPFGPWSFTWPSGVGFYEFYTRAGDWANNYEAAPASADDNAMYETTAPSSNVNTITPYFYRTTPLSVACTATEGAAPASGLAWVALYYRFSQPTNGTFGAWTLFNNDTATPFGPWAFNWPSGQGYYEFYTRAGDLAGNAEAAPGVADDNAMYDTVAPTSSVQVITTRWPDTAGNLQINVTNQADAAPASGVRGVEFWYRFAAGAWTLAFNDTAAPYNYAFTFPSGNGYYAFYSRAYDWAGNYEAAPAGNDTWTYRGPVSGPTIATATGPIGAGPLAVTITYTWTNTPASVNLYYTINGGTNWIPAGNDVTVEGSFAWTCPAAGTYGWIASAVGGTPASTEPSPPPGGTAPEATPYVASTVVAPRPENLWVERSTPNVILHWTNATNPTTDWTIYRSTNKLAAFPAGWTTATAVVAARTWTHTNALTDGSTWYYIVRGNNGGTYSMNSTMGVKVHRPFTVNAAPQTNVMWISIPYKSHLKTAMDVVIDLEGGNGVTSPSTKIEVVGKWVPGLQASTTYYYDIGFMEWGGDNFAINPGDGIYVSIISTFNWYLNGTDSSSLLSFTVNAAPQTNVMWFEIPATCPYTTAMAIVIALEGGNGVTSPSTKIEVVGKWVPNLQASTTYYYDIGFMEWGGDNFSIAPGDGIYISIISTFTWTPALITPAFK
jgi:hypothetical protein